MNYGKINYDLTTRKYNFVLQSITINIELTKQWVQVSENDDQFQ